MTSLLPIQYVTPHSITSTSASSVELNSTSNTEKQQQQQQHSHFQQQQQQQRWHYNSSTLTTASLKGALPSVTVVKPRSTPTTASSNRLAYVDALVDVNALVIELIWQLNPAGAAASTATATAPSNNKHATSKNNVVVPLRTFIQEVLKRSRTTYSTLQTALFYLFRSRPEINNYLTRMQQQQQNNNNNWEYAYINCGRRMFLASLVVASKFVQDKTYRNSAWAKIAGLPVSEVNAAERIFLNMIDYRLYISQPKFEQWHHLLHMYVEAKTLNQPTNLHDLSTLPFAATNIDYYDHHHDNQVLPSPRTTPPRSQQNYGWTLVLSPTSFLPPPPPPPSQHHYHHQHPVAAPLAAAAPAPSASAPINSNCECQTTTTTRLSKKRKTSSASSSSSCSYPPVLSMSLPSSINSSPMQTPTQISPVRMNNGTSVFNWNSPTSFDHNILHQRSFVNTNTNISNKKRKFASAEPHSRSYNLSNVRQQSNRFHS